MKQEEFVKKFCPDYEKKMKLLESEMVQSSNPVYHAAIEDSMFEDSLQNFANKICDKQKEICASDVSLYLSVDSSPDPEDLKEIINGAFTPNLSDL